MWRCGNFAGHSFSLLLLHNAPIPCLCRHRERPIDFQWSKYALKEREMGLVPNPCRISFLSLPPSLFPSHLLLHFLSIICRIDHEQQPSLVQSIAGRRQAGSCVGKVVHDRRRSFDVRPQVPEQCACSCCRSRRGLQEFFCSLYADLADTRVFAEDEEGEENVKKYDDGVLGNIMLWLIVRCLHLVVNAPVKRVKNT